jgi:Zn ribbon nucleic-acid-binding protein
MGSVIHEIDCPNCGQEATSDFYYRTQEEYTHCGNCGYYKSVTIDDRGKNAEELTPDDYKVVEVTNPFGSFKVKHKESVAYQCGSLLDEDDYNELKNNVFEEKDNIEYFSVSRLVNGNIEIEELINTNN